MFKSTPNARLGFLTTRSFAAGAGIILSLYSAVFAKTPEIAPQFAWATSAGGLKNDKIRGVAVDREGNVFVAGEAAGDVKLGSGPDSRSMKGRGELDFFLAKLDPNGRFLWTRMAGGGLIDRGYGVATDAKGNCYVTGHYQSTDADFSGTKLPHRGGYDLFVAKYDRDGNLAWIKTAGGKGYDFGHAIALDEQGNVVVSGAVEGEAEFAGTSFPNQSGTRTFCAKYRPDGTLIWAKVATGEARGAGQGVAVDRRGNIYIAGHNTGVGQFGQKPLVTRGGTAAMLIKLSASGDTLSTTQHVGEPSFHFHEVTCDPEGRVWAVGMFRGKVTIGNETITSSGETDKDALVCHYGADGKLRWWRAGKGTGIDYALGVATDGAGNSFITGEFSAQFRMGGEELSSQGGTDIYVAKFDEKGALRWLAQGGGKGSDNAYSMACDIQGNLLLAGSYTGTANFDRASITSTTRDLFVAKLNGKSTASR